MSIVTYEGFENYGSWDSIKSYLNYSNIGSPTIISSTDANGVTPRNNGSCLKLTSIPSTASSIAAANYPRVLLGSPDGSVTDYNQCVFGFAWYPTLPMGLTASAFGAFTPIGGVVRNDSNAHFYFGINSDLRLVIRKSGALGDYRDDGGWPAAMSRAWNTNARNYGCDKGECFSSQFNSSNRYSGDIISSASLLTLNKWNYIEIKFRLNRDNNFAGSNRTLPLTTLKLNRNYDDANLDGNSSLANTPHTSNVGVGPYNSKSGIVYSPYYWYVGGVYFGIVPSSTYFNYTWNTYIDDFYWATLYNSDNNDFLGRVSCKKSSYNTVANYDFSNPADGASGLSNIDDSSLDSSSMNDKATGNVIGQTIDLRASGLANEILDPIHVRQYALAQKTDTSSRLGLSATEGANTTNTTHRDLSILSAGSLVYKDYDNAPDGNEWTNAKLGNTVFKHTITQG